MNTEKLKKGGQLTEIELDEVSLVKHPANGRRFLFTKAAELEILIKTDQTFGGTSLTVNGEEVKNLEHYNFSLINWSEEDMEEWGAVPVSASWTVRESSGDGVDQVSTFSLQSTEVKKMETTEVIKLIKSEFGVDIDEAAYSALTAEKQTSLMAFATFAPGMTEPFKKAQTTAITALIAKADAEETEGSEEVDPVKAQLAAIQADLDALKAKAAEGSEEETDEDEEIEETPDQMAEVQKMLDTFKSDLEAIKKAAGMKDSAEKDLKIAKGADEEDLWPSWDLL
jgi:hypothetical protein